MAHGDLPHLARRRDGRESSSITPRKCRAAWWCSTRCTSIQAEQANDMAVRWNCKAGKCGSCSAEINGKPRLMCMTRLNSAPI